MTQPEVKPVPVPATLDATILREYDIRGQIGKNLGPDQAYLIGRAFGTLVRRKQGKHVAVGFDGRLSSPELAASLAQGLTESGVDVTRIGLCPTPMLYFTVKHMHADGGIMITGSHNPPDYNGFKMMLAGGPVFGEQVQEIGKIANQGDFETGQGGIAEVDVSDLYVERLLRDLTATRPLKIVWDNGNGAAGNVLKKLVDKLPGEHILLFDDVDGTFPNHHPDPTVDANLRDLQRAVIENSCDVGIGFDGDADRIGTVDEQGNIVRCDMLMGIYARDVLTGHPGAAIIGDVKCSQVMFDEIERLGGQPVMWKTGHSLIKAKMAELKAPLAGELSGHIFFADRYYGYDDALYCAIRLMNALSEAHGPMSSLLSHLPTLHNTPEVRVEVDEEQKFAFIDQLIQSARDNGERVNDIDGLRIESPDGWMLIRASNTQNVLVTRTEATSAAGLDRLIKKRNDYLRQIGCTIEQEFSSHA